MLIDSHAHLSSETYLSEEIPALLQRAKEAGVGAIINIGAGYGPSGNAQAVKFAEKYPQVFAAVGIHPHDASTMTLEVFEEIESLAVHPQVVAIGEIGLDYYYNHSEPPVQRRVLAELIGLARKVKKPVSIHVRDAYQELYEILDSEKAFECGGVIHCFSGDLAFAKKVIDRGFKISFSGILTFKKAEALREVARAVSLDHLLIETDAPFLTPEPWRGKRNEPAFVLKVAERLAEVCGVSLDEVAHQTTENTKKLFGLTGL